MRLFFLLVSALFLISCSDSSQHRQEELIRFRSKNGKVKVLSTIAMIGNLVTQIGKEHVDSLTLLSGDLDPHSYQLVKGDDEKLAYADIIFYNGLGLEHGPSLQHYLETSEKAIALGDKIMAENPEIILYVQGQLDPHIWMDISLWSRNISFIVSALSSIDPSHADLYQKNGEQLLAELKEIHQAIRAELSELPLNKRYLVTSHDAFNYFTRAYLATDQEQRDGTWSQRLAAPEGLAPESQLSAVHIQEIINYLILHHVHVIFPESNVSKDSIRKIVSAGKEKGLDITMAPCCLYSDAMGQPGSDGDTYQKMITHNAHWIMKYLMANP